MPVGAAARGAEPFSSVDMCTGSIHHRCMAMSVETRMPGFVARYTGYPPERLRVLPFRSGLEASGVAEVQASYRDGHGRRCQFNFVVKEMVGSAAREAVVYERWVTPRAAELAPRVFATEQLGDGRWVLYLEAVRRLRAWPWREIVRAGDVMERLAGLHLSEDADTAQRLLPAWDYEQELHLSAVATLEALERCRRHSEAAAFSPSIRAVDRTVSALTRARLQLLAFQPLRCAPLHGDVHPGNVIVTRRRCTETPVLIDWGRARLGSPLEDLSSWLHSLGAWEPEARRRHDTLLRSYLSARGLEQRLPSDMRGAYWLAGASNALAGALLHHVETLTDSRNTRRVRQNAFHSATGWLRVLRRANACWR